MKRNELLPVITPLCGIWVHAVIKLRYKITEFPQHDENTICNPPCIESILAARMKEETGYFLKNE